MNESGGSVASVRDFYQVDDDHLVVVHDELDLPYGTLRIKLGGGDNGHNGLRSVRAALGTGRSSGCGSGSAVPRDEWIPRPSS